jgi:hypothetical protein
MHVVEILLPLTDNDGRRFPADLWTAAREELIERFGGLTAFTRSPAEGLWDEGEGRRSRDEIVIFEVMDDSLDRAWWCEFRERLERDFRQEEVVVRARRVERI